MGFQTTRTIITWLKVFRFIGNRTSQPRTTFRDARVLFTHLMMYFLTNIVTLFTYLSDVTIVSNVERAGLVEERRLGFRAHMFKSRQTPMHFMYVTNHDPIGLA